MRLVLALSLALFASGCAGAGERVEALRGGDAPREPYYKEWRAVLEREHDRRHEFPVEEGASALRVAFNMSGRANGLPLPQEAPARVTVEVLDARGEALGRFVADPPRPALDVTLPGPLAGGTYAVRVQGLGVSHDLEGSSYGASYVLAVEVPY